MHKPSRKQSTNSIPTHVLLRRKLHPYRHPEMSDLMTAIPFGNPRIADMTITPDGMILARAEGEVSPLAVGRYPDLLRSWFALLNAATLVLSQTISKRLNQFHVGQLPTPVFGYPVLAVVGTCDLTIDSPGCVRIVTQIHGEETPLTKRVAAVEGPECRLKTFNDVPGAFYFWWLQSFEGA